MLNGIVQLPPIHDSIVSKQNNTFIQCYIVYSCSLEIELDTKTSIEIQHKHHRKKYSMKHPDAAPASQNSTFFHQFICYSFLCILQLLRIHTQMLIHK